MLRLSLITASNRQPQWVDDGADDYAKRLRGRCTLEIKTIPLARRTATTPVERAIDDEGERLLAAVPAGAHVVALLETRQAVVDERARGEARSLDAARRARGFLVGGPDGLEPRVRRSRQRSLVAVDLLRCRTVSCASWSPKRSIARGRCSRTTLITARER